MDTSGRWSTEAKLQGYKQAQHFRREEDGRKKEA